MHSKTALSLVFFLFALLAAGCTGTSNLTPVTTPTPVVTAAPISGTTAPATPSGGDLVPSPTDVVLASRSVSLNVEKDYLGKVIVTFQGGSGNGHVNSFDVTVKRADGQVVTDKLGADIGDVVTLQGTKDTDRVIIIANMDDGRSYKIIDMLSRFRTLG